MRRFLMVLQWGLLFSWLSLTGCGERATSPVPPVTAPSVRAEKPAAPRAQLQRGGDDSAVILGDSLSAAPADYVVTLWLGTNQGERTLVSYDQHLNRSFLALTRSRGLREEAGFVNAAQSVSDLLELPGMPKQQAMTTGEIKWYWYCRTHPRDPRCKTHD